MSGLKGGIKNIGASLKTALAPLVKDNKEVKRLLINAGAAVGGTMGPIGSAAGVHLARRISRLIGSGDYATNNVNVNSLINPKGAEPAMSFGARGSMSCIRIKHREFLGDVFTSSTAGGFVNYSYAINPGLRASFPFLSQLALNYEEYQFAGLVYEFISTASPYLSSSALGSVIASMEYNPISSPYASKFAMENSAEAVSNRIDKSLMYGVECAKQSNTQTAYYVRSGTTTAPLTSTDMGTFQLALAPGSSYPVSSVVGELWVTYDVCLDRPCLNTSRPGAARLTRGNVSTTNLFGNTQSTTNFSSGVLSGFSSTATVVSLGTNLAIGDVVHLTFYWSGTAGVSGIGAFTLSGCQNYNALNNNSTHTEVAPTVGTSSASLILDYYVQITNATAPTITANATNTGPLGGSTTCDITAEVMANAPAGVAAW